MGRVTGPGRAKAADGSVPLARLFAIAYRQLVVELHNELRRRGWTDLRPAFGFALLAVRDRPLSNVELASVMGMTKQAAAKLVDAMVEAGYVVRSASVEDGRVRLVQLTARGRRLQTTAEEIYVELESRWAQTIGPVRLAALRDDLLTVLSKDQSDMPPVRPLW